MVAGFTTICAISAYQPLKFWGGVLETTLCDKVCQWFATGRLFSLGTPVFSPNKTDCHDIAEILLKVALNNITLTRKLKNIKTLFDVVIGDGWNGVFPWKSNR